MILTKQQGRFDYFNKNVSFSAIKPILFKIDMSAQKHYKDIFTQHLYNLLDRQSLVMMFLCNLYQNRQICIKFGPKSSNIGVFSQLKQFICAM